MDDIRFTEETIRLLLYVAWADDDVTPEEYDYLLRMAQNGGLGTVAVAGLDQALRDRKSLSRPDIEFLKPYRDEVLTHVRALIRADDHIAPAETDILHKIASALA
jgi:uncharacterized tellurite resistance protein B-like protein